MVKIVKKKIVFVANRLGGGGAERVLTLLANYFVKKNYNVCILYYNSYEKQYKTDCLTRKICDEKDGIITKIFKLRQILKYEKPDIVIAFEYFINLRTIVASINLKNKLIISERNNPSNLDNRKIIKIVRDILYKRCDVLVCQTADAKNYFNKNIQKHTVVIPNPVKEDLPTPWKGTREKVIVNFCRLEKQKNLPLLIDAFEELQKTYKDYILMIYGNGKEEKYIRNYINERNLQNKVILHEATSDIHRKILKSKMFISSSDYEGISNSMIEAMAIGLPTISTNCPCGGAKMLIEDGVNGILIPVGDKEKLIKAMKIIIDNESLANELSLNARNIKKTLSIEKIFSQWERILE